MSLKPCVTILILLAVFTVFSTLVSALIWIFAGANYGSVSSYLETQPPSSQIIKMSTSESLKQTSPPPLATPTLRPSRVRQQPSPISTPTSPIPIPSVIIGGEGSSPPDGIGNQLFKYAFGYALASQLNATLFIKFPRPSTRKFRPQERDFVLDHFNLDETSFKYADVNDPLPPKDVVTIVHEPDFFEERIPENKVIILAGFWESEVFFKYYAEEVVAQYQMKLNMSESEIYKQIQATESVAVHFRFGDFVDGRRVLPFEYQLRAMKLIRQLISKELTFFVFSDDIDQVKGHMRRYSTLERLVFVSNTRGGLKSIEEFYLMRSCKHIIVANSAFSWWAAYLISNPNKTVIVPYPRYRPEFFDLFQESSVRQHKKMLADKYYAYPSSWTTLDPFADE